MNARLFDTCDLHHTENHQNHHSGHVATNVARSRAMFVVRR